MQLIEELLEEDKLTVSCMEWHEKPGNHDPQWFQFFSACEIESSVIEGLIFRAQYRGSKTRHMDGVATIEIEESYSMAIFMENHRVAAMDFSITPHTNKVGRGRPYFRQRISGHHHHIWTDEGYGYAEPLDGNSCGIDAMAEQFQSQYALVILDGFVHPLRGTQLGLPL